MKTIKKLTPEQRQIVEDNINLAYYMANKLFKQTPIEYDDVLSICFESLVRDALIFSSNVKRIQFSTFACNGMKCRVFNEVTRKYSHPSTERLEQIKNNADFKYQIEDVIDKKMAIQLTLQFFKGSQREKAVAITFVHNPNLTQMEIAQKTGVCQKTVRNGITALRKQLHERMAV